MSRYTISEPSQHIASEAVRIIRHFAGEAEQLKQLHPAQLALVHEQKWWQLFVPRQYNGLELPLPEALQLEEALAWADGSVGWTVTLCSGAGWFIGFLEPDLIATIFHDNLVCIAGSGKASGIANATGNGYEITGSWDYATGSMHATAFTANCFMEENGMALKDENGQPLIQPFLFLREEVTVHQSWNSMGMMATGSNRFEVKKLFVPKNRAFRIDARHAGLPHPVYRYPFLQFAETTLAVNSAGMALRFLDLCEVWMTGSKQWRRAIAFEQLANARLVFYENVNSSWEECLANKDVSPAMLATVSEVSRRLAATARQVVHDLFPCCGLRAADTRTEINRVWRNLHTASQHSLLNSCVP